MSTEKEPVELSIIKMNLEEIRGRKTLLMFSTPEEIDAEFQSNLEDDMAYLLSLVESVLERHPEALTNGS